VLLTRPTFIACLVVINLVHTEQIGHLQVQEYRKHIADLEAKVGSRRKGEDFSILDPSMFAEDRYRDGSLSPVGRRRDYDGGGGANFEFMSRLDDERRR
jgi:hypothetical protein